jgi:hypothetical protein
MPSVSQDQAKLMEAAAQDPGLRKEMGMSEQQVREWVAADRRRGTKNLPKRKKDDKGRKALAGVKAS